MAEYIEKKSALDAIWKGCGACAEELEQLPVVEIVRCEECKHSVFDDLYGNYWCNRNICVSKVNADDFCKWGKRKESEESGTDEN